MLCLDDDNFVGVIDCHSCAACLPACALQVERLLRNTPSLPAP